MQADLEVALDADAGEAGGTPHGEGVGHTHGLLHGDLAQRGPLPTLHDHLAWLSKGGCVLFSVNHM